MTRFAAAVTVDAMVEGHGRVSHSVTADDATLATARVIAAYPRRRVTILGTRRMIADPVQRRPPATEFRPRFRATPPEVRA